MLLKRILVVTSLLAVSSFWCQEPAKKATELNEIVIKKEKKAVEKRADRTIFDFSGQSNLNSGSVLEGLRKLPGLIISDVAGMMYQGKQLEVFMDTRPLNISSNELNAFLEGMPANAIERVEIITQPGAEFPATSGGAIINIITSKTAKNYLSATYSNGFNMTSYAKNRARFNNSILLNAKNQYFGWQLNVGQNYRESALETVVLTKQNMQEIVLSKTTADRISRSEFIRSAVTFDLKKDRLLLNYDVNFNNADAFTTANGLGFGSEDASKSRGLRQEAVVTYQKRFDDKDKKLDIKFDYANNRNSFRLNTNLQSNDVLDNVSVQDFLNFKIDYSQALKILDKGKFSAGFLTEDLRFKTDNFDILNLNYSRKTTAGYAEFQATQKKFDFIVGTRAENYDISGRTNTADLIPFKQFRFFPNASVQYNFANQIYLNLNYSKKISLPSTSSLNPNNTNYQNQNVVFGGNPQLQPTIFDNFGIELSAFDYANIGYSQSIATNQVISRILKNGNQVLNTNENLPEIKIHNINIGIPLPYMLFTKGLKETMKFDFNPDKINFMYIYAGYQKHQIPNIDLKGIWFFNVMSQVLLPSDIKFIAQYNGSTTGGNYFYFQVDKPFSQNLDLTFSKKFLNQQLSVAVNFDDVFNQNVQGISAIGTPISVNNKYDTRRFGFTINYKIPTKNKLAKEDSTILNKEKKEESSPIVN